MAASRPGHSYSNIHNSDSSRSHLGDVYNQYGPSRDQQAFQAVLESLRYDGMDDRRDRLNSAERGTFEWALAGRDADASTDDASDEEDNKKNNEGGEHGNDSDDGEQENNENDKRDEESDEDDRVGGEWGGSTDDEYDEENTDGEGDREYLEKDVFWHNTKTIDESFTDWLMSEEEEGSLFCFMGKPGSGKSTLMYEAFQ